MTRYRKGKWKKNRISTSYEKYDRVFARAFSKKQKGKIHKIRPRHHRDCVIPKVSVDVLTISCKAKQGQVVSGIAPQNHLHSIVDSTRKHTSEIADLKASVVKAYVTS